MTIAPAGVVMVGALLCAGLIGAVLALLRAQSRERMLAARLHLVAAPYARVNALSIMGRSAAAIAGPLARTALLAARLFGFHPARQDHYPLRWWVVLSGGLLAGRAGAELGALLLGPIALLLTPILWVFACRTFFNWSENRRRGALYRQFPDALAMIVRSVRVGIPLAEGIRTVAREALPPTRTEFASLHDQLAIGMTLDDALHDLAERNGLAEYRFFATALALQSQTGGGLSEALETLADVMRKRLALRQRASALAAEAKTSIVILAALPFVSGGALAVMNPAYIGRLFNETSGQHVLAAAILSLVSGLLVMRSIIARSLR
ncbi:MAG: type II secretion system F family protein [Rhodospirillales bacterium]|nr:type II secretion system F family protein [Rhodospirillales bacterium]MDE2198901.1 type II secretion system F family protein [Rhodospirillales bacterium]MDE2576130.1 type II secretion system F family protein [Rhodospirillales bacterium]